MAGYVEFPKCVYHVSGAVRVVHSAIEELALGAGWITSLSVIPPVVEVVDTSVEDVIDVPVPDVAAKKRRGRG
jgi:hypothetical protein